MPDRPHVFLSHNFADKAFVEPLAGALALLGAQVWFDSWQIKPGDSIPGEMDVGLAKFEVFVLVWSAHAAQSSWVEAEKNAAFNRWMKNKALRVIPIRLDEEPLPPLLAHILYVDARDERTAAEVAAQILGLDTDRKVRAAMQRTILESGFDFKEFWGVGSLMCCPRCGADKEKIQGWQSWDDDNDRQYVGAKCNECGWDDGSEM